MRIRADVGVLEVDDATLGISKMCNYSIYLIYRMNETSKVGSPGLIVF